MISPLKKQHQILGSHNKNSPLILNHYLPLFSQKSQKKQQNSKHKNKKNSIHNLSSSRISKQSLKSTHIESTQFHIKLPNAFYNDSKTSFYLDRSKTMSEKSMCYQVRPLSLTQRNKLQSERLESIVKRRNTEIENDENLQASFQKNITSKLPFAQPKRSRSSININSLPSSRTLYHQTSLGFQNLTKETKIFSQTQHLSCKDKFKNYTSSKYNKLIHGSKLKEIQQKMLQKDIKKIFSQKVIKTKWDPPFQTTNTLKEKFLGKKIVSSSTLKEKQQLLHNSSKTQLKVLNIDRMFRKKEGKLTNVVPLPFPKFSEVTAKRNTNLLTNKKNRDKIHDIILEFNTLLRISKLTKARTTKILGVKGKNFTKNPTFEELMGLKLRPKTNVYPQQSEQIPPQIFLQHSQTYKQTIDKSFELRSNFIEGIKQSIHTFNLQALTRFYSIFVNKIATIEEKVKFFGFFFVPSGKELIFKSEIIEILEFLCKGQNLPSISVNVKTQTLSENEKRRIFMEALIKVLFGQVNEDEVMNREMLSKILRENEEAVDLLLKLIEKRQ